GDGRAALRSGDEEGRLGGKAPSPRTGRGQGRGALARITPHGRGQGRGALAGRYAVEGFPDRRYDKVWLRDHLVIPEAVDSEPHLFKVGRALSIQSLACIVMCIPIDLDHEPGLEADQVD